MARHRGRGHGRRCRVDQQQADDGDDEGNVAGVRRQVIADQNSRTRDETVRLAKVRSGDGAEETAQ